MERARANFKESRPPFGGLRMSDTATTLAMIRSKDTKLVDEECLADDWRAF